MKAATEEKQAQVWQGLAWPCPASAEAPEALGASTSLRLEKVCSGMRASRRDPPAWSTPQVGPAGDHDSLDLIKYPFKHRQISVVNSAGSWLPQTSGGVRLRFGRLPGLDRFEGRELYGGISQFHS